MLMMRMTVLLAGLTGLLLAVGAFFGGTIGMTMMLVLSLLMNFVSYWFSDRIVLSMYGAREVTPQDAADLIRVVSGLVQKAKLPMPRVYVIDTDVPNAFATGRNPEHAAIAVTTGLMRALKYEELEGVIAHELAHIKNNDTLISTVVAGVAGVIIMTANIVQWTGFLGIEQRENKEGNGVSTLIDFIFLAMLAPLAATFIQLSISRSREFLADETGSAISGDPLALAAALEKIECYAQQKVMLEATPATSHMFIINPLSGSNSWLRSLFSTHPRTNERVERLTDLSKRIR